MLRELGTAEALPRILGLALMGFWLVSSRKVHSCAWSMATEGYCQRKETGVNRLVFFCVRSGTRGGNVHMHSEGTPVCDGRCPRPCTHVCTAVVSCRLALEARAASAFTRNQTQPVDVTQHVSAYPHIMHKSFLQKWTDICSGEFKNQQGE